MRQAIFMGSTILAVIAAAVTAHAAVAPLPSNGSTSFVAYSTCHQLGAVELGKADAQAVSECVGIVKNTTGAKVFDNMSVRCLEDGATRSGATEYEGWCAQTDLDGDKVFTTYMSADGGKVSFIGGTGKYKGISGTGTWTAEEAPQPAPAMGAVALSFSLAWTIK